MVQRDIIYTIKQRPCIRNAISAVLCVTVVWHILGGGFLRRMLLRGVSVTKSISVNINPIFYVNDITPIHLLENSARRLANLRFYLRAHPDETEIALHTTSWHSAYPTGVLWGK